MALIRWQPFQEMDSLQRDLNRLFDVSKRESSQQFVPLAEISETEDKIYLEVEVPGMNTNDLDVQVTKEAVAIYGKRVAPSRLKQNPHAIQSEFRYGKFSRVIALPTLINNSAVRGSYQNGILTLELPKLQEENTAVKVNLSSSGDRPTSESTEPEPESDAANADAEKPNKPDGGYGNTTETDLWNDKESSDSDRGDRSSTKETE